MHMERRYFVRMPWLLDRNGNARRSMRMNMKETVVRGSGKRKMDITPDGSEKRKPADAPRCVFPLMGQMWDEGMGRRNKKTR